MSKRTPARRKQPLELEPFADPAVADAFAAFDDGMRPRLLELRQLIFDTARRVKSVGPLSESLKWGQPSYAPKAPRTGSPVRLGVADGSPALLFHCQTTLVVSFRQRHGKALRFEGNRAMLLEPSGRLPRKALVDCITAALTYHLQR